MVSEVAIEGSFRRLVDLTHPLSGRFPSFDGAVGFTLEPGPPEPDGFQAHRWRLEEHFGTHLDAPGHVAGGRSLDRIALADLVAPAVVVDVREAAASDPDHALTVEELRRWEARYGEIPRGAAVLMWSGWDARAGDPRRYRNADARGVLRFPGFHVEAACFLRDARAVRGLGVDTLSLDPGREAGLEVHRAWLRHDRWGLENLCNLGALPPVGALLVVGALKVEGATGGPVRALALAP